MHRGRGNVRQGRDHVRKDAAMCSKDTAMSRPRAPKNEAMCVKDAVMCAKNATLSAKDAAMCAKDAAMCAKTRPCARISGDVCQGRSHVRLRTRLCALRTRRCVQGRGYVRKGRGDVRALVNVGDLPRRPPILPSFFQSPCRPSCSLLANNFEHSPWHLRGPSPLALHIASREIVTVRISKSPW